MAFPPVHVLWIMDWYFTFNWRTWFLFILHKSHHYPIAVISLLTEHQCAISQCFSLNCNFFPWNSWCYYTIDRATFPKRHRCCCNSHSFLDCRRKCSDICDENDRQGANHLDSGLHWELYIRYNRGMLSIQHGVYFLTDVSSGRIYRKFLLS